MPKPFSDDLKANLIQTSADESPLYILEINNAMLGQPIRLVRDNEDVVSNGDTYVACMFDLKLPNESKTEVSRAVLSIDNISRDITRFLEQMQGAPNTSATITMIKRSDPDFVEFSFTMDLINISVTRYRINAQLQYDRTLNEPACNQIYNKRNAVGLY